MGSDNTSGWISPGYLFRHHVLFTLAMPLALTYLKMALKSCCLLIMAQTVLAVLLAIATRPHWSVVSPVIPQPKAMASWVPPYASAARLGNREPAGALNTRRRAWRYAPADFFHQRSAVAERVPARRTDVGLI